jgi:hypothetical protein
MPKLLRLLLGPAMALWLHADVEVLSTTAIPTSFIPYFEGAAVDHAGNRYVADYVPYDPITRPIEPFYGSTGTLLRRVGLDARVLLFCMASYDRRVRYSRANGGQ